MAAGIKLREDRRLTRAEVGLLTLTKRVLL